MKNPVFYRTIEIDGFSIFYRESGSERAPTLLLLHGLPSSSRMYECRIDTISSRRIIPASFSFRLSIASAKRSEASQDEGRCALRLL